ncbi:hypothetical protein DPX16_7890 [Anabarilius grahami]|uniref:Uncharacterized protein n=1 Tax=Anabarilius grahami TaxID=495550 RepID=A0A3N0Y7M7_ANAGA|nr:hypothetical protein DPX16_7890 [Anabarilius grahami]
MTKNRRGPRERLAAEAGVECGHHQIGTEEKEPGDEATQMADKETQYEILERETDFDSLYQEPETDSGSKKYS